MCSAIFLLLATISLRDIKSKGPPGRKREDIPAHTCVFAESGFGLFVFWGGIRVAQISVTEIRSAFSHILKNQLRNVEQFLLMAAAVEQKTDSHQRCPPPLPRLR